MGWGHTSISVPPHERQARDITDVGCWGNGDVELGLSKVEEMPYVMGLVRQAFEKQMGNGEADS